MSWNNAASLVRRIAAVSLVILFIFNGASSVWAGDGPAGSQEGPNWILLVLRAMAILAVILAIVIDVNLVIGVLQWNQQRYKRLARIEIENLGNVRSPFRLRVGHPSGDLEFGLEFEGIELTQQTDLATPVAADTPAAAKEGRRTSAPSPSAPNVNLKEAQEKAAQARGVSYLAANLLGTIASILPNSMAAPLRRTVSNIRQKQAAVSRVERAPRQMTRKVGQTRRLFKKKSPGKEKAPKQARQGPQTPAEDIWHETPEVDPGETIEIELQINPFKRPGQTQDYSISVLSQVAGGSEASAVSETYDIRFEKVSWIRHAIPFILIGILFIAEIVLIWFLIRSTGLIGS